MQVEQLRTRKRIVDAFESRRLESLDSTCRIELVKHTAELFDRRLDRDVVEERSGRHRGSIERSVDATVNWLASVDDSLENAFGSTEYARQPFAHSAADAATTIRNAGGPVVAVLPRNDRGDLAPYVLAQCLLAGCPFVAVPSTREAATYVTETYVECLRDACKAILDEPEAIADAFAVTEIADDREEKLDGLTTLVTGTTQLVAFGSDDGIDRIVDGLDDAGTAPQTVIRMGSGHSATAVLVPDEERIDEYCREICASVAFDRGDDCTATNVLYVDESVSEAVRAGLHEAIEQLVPGEDFVPPTPERAERIATKLPTVSGSAFEESALPVVELAESDPVEEYPVPILQVKSVSGVDGFVETMCADLGDRRSLALSVFTDGVDVTELAPRVPAHLIKENRPTHRIDLSIPHQGRFLVADLMEKRYVEHAPGTSH